MMTRMVHMVCAFTVTVLGFGCFKGAQVRYVIDVKAPIDRKQPVKHSRQDKDHPQVGEIRSEVPIKSE
jgi:hypothetical protein